MNAPRKWQVACPAGLVTGGPEALHQLAHTARTLGIDARMVYLGAAKASTGDRTPEPYRIYAPVVDASLDDSPGTLVIVPETETPRLRAVRRAARAIWWLSIDNYEVMAEHARQRWRRYWWKRWNGKVALPFELATPDPGILHLAQSEYARQVLARHRIDNTLMLTDFLRDDFLAQASSCRSQVMRQARRVAYNPKKGFEATERVIAEAGGRFEFVPIQGMSAPQVVQLLCSAAVYIDFGHHPGRDRIPREAVACGCRVLTGRRGAAANEIDIPVPQAFKIDETAPGFAACAVAALQQLIDDPESSDAAFERYRGVIHAQRERFADEVRRLAERVGTPLAGATRA
ncbi:MAG: hypothetical protein WAQ05_25690 [Rubrivivax sp.]